MATIKPIEGRTVHQIQSGQVIVDLCSVVKELAENSIDAGATSIDVRFKNQGLDSIEVQDNGSGISPDNYESIALKHYTSKLATYSDLATLQTFGFRGEALSSLCALSRFSIVTCLAKDVPKGTKLDFETSGNLKGTHVVAAQKGTNVVIEDLFHNLPVRRRELERNIKREWNKVIALLNQYACIQTGVKFTVSQQPSKGKRIILFSTKGNLTTRENLVNIFGAKTMTVLVKLDLTLEFEPTAGPGLKLAQQDKKASTEVRVQGYVSRPAHGEGRQTPDRQMFFVNGRPCGLPQFAKVFNEVYRSYNTSQSPFIFADIQLDTHLYDVNVSPDKRTIMLHDQNRMLENLRETLVTLFQSQDYSIPVAQASTQKPKVQTQTSTNEGDASESEEEALNKNSSSSKKILHTNPDDDSRSGDDDDSRPASRPTRRSRTAKPRKLTTAELQSQSLISRWVGKGAGVGGAHGESTELEARESSIAQSDTGSQAVRRSSVSSSEEDALFVETPKPATKESASHSATTTETPRRVIDFRARLAEGNMHSPLGDSSPLDALDANDSGEDTGQEAIPAITPIRTPRDANNTPTSALRPHKRPVSEVATVTIGDRAVLGHTETSSKKARVEPDPGPKEASRKVSLPFTAASSSFGTRLTQMFSAGQASQVYTRANIGVEGHKGAGATVADDDSDNGPDVSIPSTQDVPFVSTDTVSIHGRTARSSPGLVESSSPMDGQTMETPGRNSGGVSDRVPLEGSSGLDNVAEPANVTETRSHAIRAGIKRKDATLQYEQHIKTNEASLRSRTNAWISQLDDVVPRRSRSTASPGINAEDAEEVLSLIISKSDFGKMTIVGQFNLGFIIAVRQAPRSEDGGVSAGDDELFIIDQHASDEKYNFERLQSTTVVQSQRLVHPKQLELTALEEEIVMENVAALDVNGFKVHVDDSGEQPVGSRCKLLALPLSRETTFTLSDLEELISLLGDHHLTEVSSAPRPSKVRSMFAMRACRSSVMIGKALAHRQMEKLVRHMGELDKPWNCPHGRPTMRHLSSLGSWDEKGWKEAEPRVNWAKYAQS